MRIIKSAIELILLLILFIGCPIDPNRSGKIMNQVPIGFNQSEIVAWSISNYNNWTHYATITNNNAVIAFGFNPLYQLIHVGSQPVGIALWEGGNRLYVVNNGGLSISVIAVSTTTLGKVVGSITDTSFHSMGDAVVTPDGQYLYVATDTNAISVISTATNTVLQTFTDPGFNQPAHLVADMLGRYIFVSESAGNVVSVISTTTNTVIKTIGVGISPNGMAQTPDGDWLFVVNSGSNNISVIDVNSLTVTRTVTDTSFDNPQRIVLTYGCAYGFISEYSSGDISLISQNALITGSGKVVIKNIPVGSQPYDLAIIRTLGWPSYIGVTLKGENYMAFITYPMISEINSVCH